MGWKTKLLVTIVLPILFCKVLDPKAVERQLRQMVNNVLEVTGLKTLAETEVDGTLEMNIKDINKVRMHACLPSI